MSNKDFNDPYNYIKIPNHPEIEIYLEYSKKK